MAWKRAKTAVSPEEFGANGRVKRSGGHLCVVIITVGGQEDLGPLLDAAQEDGQVGLWRTPFWFQ